MISNNDGGIPCPVCNSKIPFDVHQLLLGQQFACPTCNAVIGLAQESRQAVKSTMQKLEDVKKSMDAKKSNELPRK